MRPGYRNHMESAYQVRMHTLVHSYKLASMLRAQQPLLLCDGQTAPLNCTCMRMLRLRSDSLASTILAVLALRQLPY
jgi:hypothetical protein